MKKMQGQVQPGTEKEEPRQSSDWHAAAPRQEERGFPLPFLYGNSRGQDCGSPPVPRLVAVGDAQATYGYEHPDGYSLGSRSPWSEPPTTTDDGADSSATCSGTGFARKRVTLDQPPGYLPPSPRTCWRERRQQ